MVIIQTFAEERSPPVAVERSSSSMSSVGVARDIFHAMNPSNQIVEEGYHSLRLVLFATSSGFHSRGRDSLGLIGFHKAAVLGECEAGVWALVVQLLSLRALPHASQESHLCPW